MDSTEAAIPERQTTRSLQSVAHVLLRMRALFALALLVVAFSAIAPSFLTSNNLVILTKHVAINAILAIGMTFVIVAGGIDLSVGSVAGLSGMVAGALIFNGILFSGMRHPYYPAAWLVVLLALGTGALVGWLNGILISRFSVAPFIATLGTFYVARGVALLISNGRTYPDLAGEGTRHNTGFPTVGQGHWLGISTPVWIMLVLAVAAHLVATRTPFGRHVFAVGGNARAALLSGIRVNRVTLLTYVFSGICAAITGIIIAAQLEAAHPATGQAFELNAIAAVVLGGTSLMGGRGTIYGSVAGAFVIGVLADGLVMLGVSEFWQIVIKGLVIVLAVVIDQSQSRLQNRLLRAA